MARLQCPNCSSENTWAQYVHDPCPKSPTGKTEWEAQAEGATPDGRPYPSPCPAPARRHDDRGFKRHVPRLRPHLGVLSPE